MTNYLSRAARFDLNIPLSFTSEYGVENGHCVNVSSSGLLAMFDHPVELFTIGELFMLVGEHYLDVRARVARVHEGDHGMAFKIKSDNDRNTVRLLLDYATGLHQPLESKVAKGFKSSTPGSDNCQTPLTQNSAVWRLISIKTA